MADVTFHNHENSGLILATGATIRPRDPREDKYALARTAGVDLSAVDLSTPHSITWADGWDPRPAITNQGNKGACASFTVCEIAEILSWQSGNGAPALLSGSDLYERVRKAENGAAWTQDTGSTLAGNLDLAMTGLYSVSEAPEGDDLAENYDALTADQVGYDYLLGHQPF